jgi:AcrR family transcriptional regulator
MMERKLIFDSALRLIKEGKFLGSPMSEVAYHARLTEQTVSHFFENRNQLVTELAVYIVDGIRSAVEGSRENTLSYQDRFFNAWFGLFSFYVKHPTVLAFVEQCPNLAHLSEPKLNENNFIAPLVEFFQSAPQNIQQRFQPGSLAILFHGSIATAVKLKSNTEHGGKDAEIGTLPAILWNGITRIHAVGYNRNSVDSFSVF